MRRVVFQDLDLTVPEWVTDLASFERWAESGEFPESGRIDFLAGVIWIDTSEEQIWEHNQVKAEFTIVLGRVAKSTPSGRYFPHGVRVRHPQADLSVAPDAIFVSNQRLQDMRVRFVAGAVNGYVRIEGSPDMALEVVSDSSVRKDHERLRILYWEAGIPEYWLVDARGETPSFDILRRTAKGYVATCKQDGWVKSAVFGKSFRLLQETDELGHPTFTLEVL